MGRPLSKMNKEKVEYLMENYRNMTNVALADELDVSIGTVRYWINKLQEHDLLEEKQESEADELIRTIKKEKG